MVRPASIEFAHMEILTTFQRQFLIDFGSSDLGDHFFLTGGTALSAFFLQHRYSEDLDFFTERPGHVPQVLPALEQIAQRRSSKIDVRRQFATFLEVVVHGAKGEMIKCEFAQDSPFRLQTIGRRQELGIYVDNALDISCNKLSALFDRTEAKDFVDIFFIDHELFPFAELLSHAKRKHVGLDEYWLAVSLLKAEDIGPLPRMVRPVSTNELKDFFLHQAKLLMK